MGLTLLRKGVMMTELKSLYNELRRFVQDNRSQLLKWLVGSLFLTAAVNLLLWLLPLLPLALLIAALLVGWQYVEWKHRSKGGNP
jgi:hypothetical protein